MKYYQTVLPFPLGSESFCFPTNTGERGDIAACYLLVPSFPQGMRLEQQLHIFLAPAGTSLWPHVLCHSPTQGTAHICHKQICALGTKIKYRGGKKKKAFSWWGWSNPGTEWLVSLWSLHPSGNWKPGWTLLWAIRCSCLCLEQG